MAVIPISDNILFLSNTSNRDFLGQISSIGASFKSLTAKERNQPEKNEKHFGQNRLKSAMRFFGAHVLEHKD